MVKIAPSVMCIDFLNFRQEIETLDKAGVDYFHIDIMDGHFVPNFSLNLQTVKDIKRISKIPVDVHLMIENPELYVEQFLDAGTEMISFHIEAVKHPNRLLKAIRSYNAAACIAVNPATSMDFLPYVIDNIDAILIMTVDPGFAGQKYIPAVIDKIRKTRDYLDMIGKKILIEVDGNISYEVSPKVINAGADILVVGTSSIFTGKDELIKNFQKYRNFLDQIINKSNVEQEVS